MIIKMCQDFHSSIEWCLETSGTRTHETAERGTQHPIIQVAQTDPDLASVRGDRIDTLPEPERTPWRTLWSAVATLLKPPHDPGAEPAEEPDQAPVAGAAKP
jgi:hypothetical protein